MTDRDEISDKVAHLIAPFNKKGVALTDATQLRRRSRMGQPGGDGFRRQCRRRVRHSDHHEHAGRDRECRPAHRRDREPEDGRMSGSPAAPEPRAAPDLFAKFDPLIAQRQALLDTGVQDPFSLVMEKVLSPTRAVCNGKETILLGTYNYMGMTFDPDVIAAGKQALDEYGSGTTGSRGPQRHLCRPQGLRGGAERVLRHGPCHGLFDRLPGQPRHHFDHRRQGRLHRPRHRQPRVDLRRLRDGAMPRSCPSATTTSPPSKSVSRGFPRAPATGRARGRLFDARRHRRR